jgi:ABC-type amino acid transport substrate-binding protein
MKRIQVLSAVLLLAAILLTSCRGAEDNTPPDATWDRIENNGKIVVGVSMDYPPFEYIDSSYKADGFDIAMITALGEQMGFPMEVRNYAFNGLYNALLTGQIDIAISAITVTTERQQAMMFSNVYLTDTASALAPPGSSLVITSTYQLPAYRVGVQQGSVYDSYMTKTFVDPGMMPSTQLYRFINNDDLVANLSASKIDLALMDSETAQVYQQKNSLKMAGTGFNPQRYAIAMPLNSPTLQANINEALTKLTNNGTLGALAKKYLDADPNTAVPPSCVDDMAYVADVTYDDKNMTAPPTVTPGQVFVKTWRVKNTGTCSWVPGYQLVYAYGNTPASQMSGQPVPIVSTVAPGATVDLSATLTAPTTPGVYQGFWQMNNASKQAFGQTIWVGVTVVDPSKPTPAPVPAPYITSFRVEPGSITLGQCVQASWSVEGFIDRIVFERNGEDLVPYAPVSGTYTDCPTIAGQVQYGLGAYGPGGQDNMNVYVSVSEAPSVSNPIATPQP